MVDSKIVHIIIKVVDWLVFTSLGILAITSVIESWDAYTSQKTVWHLEHESVPDQPTFYLTFGLSSKMKIANSMLVLGTDFNIQFQAGTR